jgi:hypothetical protein
LILHDDVSRIADVAADVSASVAADVSASVAYVVERIQTAGNDEKIQADGNDEKTRLFVTKSVRHRTRNIICAKH